MQILEHKQMRVNEESCIPITFALTLSTVRTGQQMGNGLIWLQTFLLIT